MRIMDAALLLFQRPVDKVQQDPDRPTVKPSWGEALKVVPEFNLIENFWTFVISLRQRVFYSLKLVK